MGPPHAEEVGLETSGSGGKSPKQLHLYYLLPLVNIPRVSPSFFLLSGFTYKTNSQSSKRVRL